MDILPPARTQDLVVQELGKEILIYDLRINKAYCLNETSSSIFNACNGQTSFTELKRKTKLTDDLIYFGLDELYRENLINGEYFSKFTNISRREVIKKIGLASVIALPVISSITAPKAAQAASVCNDIGNACFSGSCCSDLVCCGAAAVCLIPIAAATACTADTQCCAPAGVRDVICKTGRCCVPAGSDSDGVPARCCSRSANASICT